jgi:hypothetical protein
MSFERKNYIVALISAIATVAGVWVAYLGLKTQDIKGNDAPLTINDTVTIDTVDNVPLEEPIPPPFTVENSTVASKEVIVSGIVISDNEEPILGATIKNTCSGAIVTTDDSGSFSFKLQVTDQTKDCTLIFKKEGFKMERLNIHQFPKTDIVQILYKQNK